MPKSKVQPKEWMQKLKWDGKKRLATFFTSYFGSTFGPYSRQLGIDFWVSMVNRVFNPGCVNDHTLVLEGAQGIGKSSALAVIGGKWYCQFNVTTIDQLVFLNDSVLVEIQEVDDWAMSDRMGFKKFITAREDWYRLAYSKKVSRFKRRCVFVGTSNGADDYLVAPNAGRRFWPIKVNKVLLAKLKADRKQLFAEAVKFYKAGWRWKAAS